MFLIESNDEFLINNLNHLSIQKKINLIFKSNSYYFSKIFIHSGKKNIEIIYDDKNYKITKPFKYDQIFSCIVNYLSAFYFEFHCSYYYPIKQTFIFENKSVRLGKIHHEILSNLLLRYEDGINKFDLYQIIWPEDKDISINKLETHITNLKNLLLSKVGFVFDIPSNSGQLRIA